MTDERPTYLQFAHDVLKLWWGDPRLRIPKLLIIAGLALVASPWWQPVVYGCFSRWLQLEESTLAASGRTMLASGWGLIILGVGLYVHATRDNRATDKEMETTTSVNFNGYELQLGPVALASAKRIGIRTSELLQLLEKEVANHPLLLRSSYGSLPVPLKKSLTGLLTREDNTVTLDDVTEIPANRDVVDSWRELSQAYFKATQLPFRQDQNVLLRHHEFRRSVEALYDVAAAVQRYFTATGTLHQDMIHARVHELKGLASRHIIQAERIHLMMEGDVEDPALSGKGVGDIAVHLDLAISSVHKILLEHAPPT